MRNVAERLRSTYPFSDDIIEIVNNVASHPAQTYREFLKSHNITGPIVIKQKGLPPVQVLDLIPDGKYDAAHAGVLHLPMANGLTPNKVLRAVTLHLANPDERLIVFGNPGAHFKHGYGKVPANKLLRVARGDLGPVVESGLVFLRQQGISSTVQYGYSFGADRALAMAGQAEKYGIKVSRVIVGEPAAIKHRGLVRLMRDFQSANKGLKATLATAETPLLKDSRSRQENKLMFTLSLLRASNVAVANALAKDGFARRVRAVLQSQPDVRIHIMWGGASELADDAIMRTLLRDLEVEYGNQVTFTRFPDHNHSMADDIALHSAMMLHGLKATA